MNEEFENASIDIEQLLREKNWSQLSAAERAELKKLGCAEEEYERMYSMVHQLIAGSGVHDERMKPHHLVRENLLSAFENEQKKRRAMWWSGWCFRLSGAVRFDIPAVRFGVAALVLIVGAISVFNFLKHDESVPVIAKKESIQPLKETPKETPATNKNITIEPEKQQSVPQNIVPQEENIQIVPAPANNGQVVNQNVPAIVDTNTNRLAMNPVDTNALVISPITAFTNGSNLCCGSNVTLSPTSNGGSNYSWNATSNGTVMTGGNINYTIVGVNGLPPRARALSNDAVILDVYFEMR
jgi:hypothetical protein